MGRITIHWEHPEVDSDAANAEYTIRQLNPPGKKIRRALPMNKKVEEKDLSDGPYHVNVIVRTRSGTDWKVTVTPDGPPKEGSGPDVVSFPSVSVP